MIKRMFRPIFWVLFLIVVLFVVPVAFAQADQPYEIGMVSVIRVLAWVTAATSLILDYFPPVARWYEKVDPAAKRLISVGFAILYVASIFVGTCLQWFSSSLVCSRSGAIDAGTGIILVIILQHGFHGQTKPSADMKDRLSIT